MLYIVMGRLLRRTYWNSQSNNVAVPLQFPFGHLEAMPKMDSADETDLRDLMREKYVMPIAPTAPNIKDEYEDGEVEDIEATETEQKSGDDMDIEPGDSW